MYDAAYNNLGGETLKQLQLRVRTYNEFGEVVNEDELSVDFGSLIIAGEQLRVYDADELLDDKPYSFDGHTVICQLVSG